MSRRHARIVWGVLAAGWAGMASAQAIYTCVDAQGRRLTSDRPIMACLDRSQHELNPSGTVRRQLGPSLTASERAEIEARERKAAEERARANEELRRNRALLARYRDQSAHDRARAEALAPLDGVLDAAEQRNAELSKQRKALDQELEFYPNTPRDKLPAALRRQLDEHQTGLDAHQRYLADQQAERARVNERYDAELARLRQLWAGQEPAPPRR